jgi:hypothetical protein
MHHTSFHKSNSQGLNYEINFDKIIKNITQKLCDFLSINKLFSLIIHNLM